MSTVKQTLSRMGLLESAKRARNAARRAASLVLHPLREALVRIPDPWFLFTQGRALAPRYRQHLEELRRYEITRLSGEIPPEALTELQTAFAEFVGRLDRSGRSAANYDGDITLTEEYLDPEGRQHSSNEPSGNRSLGRTRDTSVIEYTRLSNAVWAHRIPPEFLVGIDARRLQPLQWILRQDRRTRPLAPPRKLVGRGAAEDRQVVCLANAVDGRA
jgi:hypothetical protein